MGWGERIVCTKETECLYGAVKENSIDFLKILYRLFPDTSIQTLGRHGINDLFVWEHRFIPIVLQPRLLGRKQRDRTRIGEECAQVWGGPHSEMGKRCVW